MEKVTVYWNYNLNKDPSGTQQLQLVLALSQLSNTESLTQAYYESQKMNKSTLVHDIKITWRQFGDFFFFGANLLKNTRNSIFLISYSSHEYFFIQSSYNFRSFIRVQLFVHIQPHCLMALLYVPLQISLKMYNSCCNWFIGDKRNSALTWEWFHLQHNQ